MTQGPSFDVDLPLEVDDEYWETEDPSAAFQQPLGIPSKVGAFILFIKLSQIVAFAMKTVVSASMLAHEHTLNILLQSMHLISRKCLEGCRTQIGASRCWTSWVPPYQIGRLRYLNTVR